MDLDEKKIDVLNAYAKNNMRIKPTAKELFFSGNTIEYHLKQIHKITGLNPRNFYDLVKLIEVIKNVES